VRKHYQISSSTRPAIMNSVKSSWRRARVAITTPDSGERASESALDLHETEVMVRYWEARGRSLPPARIEHCVTRQKRPAYVMVRIRRRSMPTII